MLPFHSVFRSVFSLAAGLAVGLGVTVCGVASAEDFHAGSIAITHPYARATVPGQPTGGAYLSIENKGKEPDTLKSISTGIAKSSELHTMAMDGNVMRMREVGSVDIKPSEKIAMQPSSGYHIMLVGLNKPLKAGDSFPMTLTFAKAGKVVINVDVEAFGSTGSNAGSNTAAKPMDHMKMPMH